MAKTTDARELKGKYLRPAQRTTLKPWHRLALAQSIIYGKTYKEVVEDMRGGKGLDTIRKVATSPAGKEFKKHIESLTADPNNMLRMILASAQLEVLSDWWAAFKTAGRANDYDAVHRMAKDIGLQQLLESQKVQQPATTMVINLQTSDLEDTEKLPSEVEVLEADWEES